MADPRLGETDRAILHALQENAGDNTNAAISEHVDVSASTVGERISRLQDRGIIMNYRPELDHEEAGFPRHILFICTAPIADREPMIREAIGLDGVVTTRELMTDNNRTGQLQDRSVAGLVTLESRREIPAGLSCNTG